MCYSPAPARPRARCLIRPAGPVRCPLLACCCPATVCCLSVLCPLSPSCCLLLSSVCLLWCVLACYLSLFLWPLSVSSLPLCCPALCLLLPAMSRLLSVLCPAIGYCFALHALLLATARPAACYRYCPATLSTLIGALPTIVRYLLGCATLPLSGSAGLNNFLKNQWFSSGSDALVSAWYLVLWLYRKPFYIAICSLKYWQVINYYMGIRSAPMSGSRWRT